MHGAFTSPPLIPHAFPSSPPPPPILRLNLRIGVIDFFRLLLDLAKRAEIG